MTAIIYRHGTFNKDLLIPYAIKAEVYRFLSVFKNSVTEYVEDKKKCKMF